MSDRPTGPVVDDEVLTYSQIKERYADGWVLVENPVHHEGECLFGGRVVYFGKDRESVYDAIPGAMKRKGVLFTGKRVGPFSLNLR